MNIRKQNIPVVILNNILDMDDLLCVTTDQYGGACLAMRHLVERGHKNIGLIAGAFSPHVYSARYNGYMDVLREIGQKINMKFVLTVDSVTVNEAMLNVKRILSLDDHPTAFFCTNDTIAIGAIKAVLRSGLKIPDDIAIIGFDDSESSSMIEPELTTVRIDKALMGQICAEKLIALINGEKIDTHIIQTSVELVVRQTT
jgi:DNA-binding LacI/PurR family transcriptional regulator